MIRISKLLVVLGLVFYTSYTEAQPPEADHHIHIRSEEGTAAFTRILEKVKGRKGIELRPAVGAEYVTSLMDSAETRKATLLSTAYFFGMPEINFKNERDLVRRENEFVARQAAQNPDRLAAFCAVNPLRDYAPDEIRWCGNDGRFSGLKLHLANSDVDLRNKEHVARLADVFESANKHGLAIVIHLWTRHPDYGAKDVEIFMNRILPHAPDVPVQVAHLGGPGQFSPLTNEVARAFASEIDDPEKRYDNLYFDLAAVPLNPENAGNQSERRKIVKRNQMLADRIRDLGSDRVLWGTDWVAGPPAVYLSKLSPVPLPAELWKTLHDNQAPYLR